MTGRAPAPLAAMRAAGEAALAARSPERAAPAPPAVRAVLGRPRPSARWTSDRSRPGRGRIGGGGPGPRTRSRRDTSRREHEGAPLSRLRWLTAGESHGPALVATLEGLPAGVPITTDMVADALARRRLGYGRGARMKFERDEVTFLGGVRHGLTLGSPVAIMVGNTEWPKWEQVMAADPVDPEMLEGLARNAPLTRPRPGHADLAGMQKYGFDEARPILERASARETAARVALGAVARSYLKETAGHRDRLACGRAGRREGAVRRLPDARRRREAGRRPGALPGRRRERRRWSPRSTRPTRTATPSAASSRCWRTACRWASARMCTGTAGSTPGWPPR